ncbi:unnamed protein product [Durusdinium trenchii]|uniref:Uncharacterized protein n=1 Tax=Durusdinium trenchii TaxID=1381693 RepID=A0ABP0LTB0_9DINO
MLVGVARVRKLAPEETQKMIDEAKRDAPDIWAKVAVERILESGSSQLMPSASATSVKTLASRFAYVSSEITCPSGCAGLTRYGHRVGDLSKYAAMERENQLTSVLAYCPTCELIFDATI